MNPLQLTTLGIALVAAIGSLSILFREANLASPFHVFLALCFALWAITPYALLLLLHRIRGRHRSGHLTISILTFLLASFGLAVYSSAFYPGGQRDAASGGMAFILIPVLQTSIAALLAAALPQLERWGKTLR